MSEYFAQELFEKLDQENAIKLLLEGQKRAVSAGHNFYGGSDAKQALVDLQEELDELKEAIDEKHTSEAVRNEIGDVLFGLINICRLMDIPFEKVSDKLAHRWLGRKALQEKKVQESGHTWKTLPDDLSSQFWRESKQELKNKEYL
jgi:tetrapyrrole methylase family protein/MazG family protein